MIQKIKNIKFILLSGLIIISFIIRLIAAYFLGDESFESASTEWSVLVFNLIENKSYSLYYFDGLFIPSVYMPPGYPILLYLIKIASLGKINFLNLIMLFQIILGTYSVYIFYKINLRLFSEKLSLINSFIFSFFPLNIYMVGQISSITLQVFLSILFLHLLFSVIEKQKETNIIFFAIASGVLILTRGEFILIFFVIILFAMAKRQIKSSNLLKIILIVSLVVSPYLIRNYYHFNQIVLVKSLGFNLWKGNNKLSLAEGYEEYDNYEFRYLKSELNKLKKNKYYEINRDKLFLDHAKNYLIENPNKYLNLFFKKIFSFYFVDFKSTYPNYYNFFHFLPVIVLATLSFPGLLIFLKKKRIYNNYLGLYLFFNLIIFSIFFILPRFKLIILPVQIILAAYFIKYMLEKLNINK